MTKLPVVLKCRSVRPCTVGQIRTMFPRIPPRYGGALRAIVTTREAGSDGRERSQRFFGGADERRSCGREVAWSWRPEAGAKFVTMLAHRTDDGG